MTYSLSTIRHVLDPGQLVDKDRHQELLEREDLYSRLYAAHISEETEAIRRGTFLLTFPANQY